MDELLMMNEASRGQVITRFSPPGQYDMLPKGSIISVIETDPYQEVFYIQRSSNTDQPVWEKI
jgi:hypothetical protein